MIVTGVEAMLLAGVVCEILGHICDISVES